MRPLTGETREPGAALVEPTRRSRVVWRLARLWRRRGVRRALTVQGPAIVMLALTTGLASDPATHVFLTEQARALGEALTARPRFAVTRIEISGASPELAAEVREVLVDAEGASSLTLDAAALRERIEKLGEVARARVELEAPDALKVAVFERRPAAVWRGPAGLKLIDADGAAIAVVEARAARPDLPLLAGRGADRAAREGLAVLAAATPLSDRLRGLVRVGERRWNVALTRGVTIMLPAERPVEALEQALSLDRRWNILQRDVVVIDVRLPEKPALRLGPDALEAREMRLEASKEGRRA